MVLHWKDVVSIKAFGTVRAFQEETLGHESSGLAVLGSIDQCQRVVLQLRNTVEKEFPGSGIASKCGPTMNRYKAIWGD